MRLNASLQRLMQLDALLNEYSPEGLTMEQIQTKLRNSERYSEAKSYSEKTIRRDLQFLREQFNAPLLPKAKGGRYRYEQPFSLARSPLLEAELEVLRQISVFLEQFRGFHFARQIKNIIELLQSEDLSEGSTKPMIVLENIADFQGLIHTPVFLTAMRERKVCRVQYQPYGGEVLTGTFKPYHLKEYNRRWYAVGHWSHFPEGISPLGVDRILSVVMLEDRFEVPVEFDPIQYFHDVVGVTVPQDGKLERVVIRVKKNLAPYLKTNRIHRSQEILLETDSFTDFQFHVKINREFQNRLAQYFHEFLDIEPQHLKEQWVQQMERAVLQLK
jgi:predicted DNA-binding transcriptional regulator YafY